MDWLRYKWQLMLLTRKRKNAINIETATWATLAEDAKMEHLLKVGRTNIEPFEEDIDKLHSSRLSARAQKYRVPESHFDYYWSKHRKHFLLKPTAVEALSSAIHEARKRRGEVFRLWLPAITSVLSALIALAAVILAGIKH